MIDGHRLEGKIDIITGSIAISSRRSQKESLRAGSRLLEHKPYRAGTNWKQTGEGTLMDAPVGSGSPVFGFRRKITTLSVSLLAARR